MEWVTTFVSIFAIVDPITALPIYMSLTSEMQPDAKLLVSRRSVLLAGSILLINAIIGDALFRFFGISMPAFQIAGGLLLLLLAIQQLFFRNQRRQLGDESSANGDVSVFPLAMPVLAGPGAMSTVTLLASRSDHIFERVLIVASILVVMSLSFLVFRNASFIYRKFGATGIDLFMRIMAVILAALAVQFIIDGIKAIFMS